MPVNTYYISQSCQPRFNQEKIAAYILDNNIKITTEEHEKVLRELYRKERDSQEEYVLECSRNYGPGTNGLYPPLRIPFKAHTKMLLRFSKPTKKVSKPVKKVSKPVKKVEKKTKSNWGYPKKKDGKRDMRYTEKCWLNADGTPDYRRF